MRGVGGGSVDCIGTGPICSEKHEPQLVLKNN